MEHRVRRTGNVDLAFTGDLLAEQSTYEDGALRWAELRIWRTDSGRYVVQRLGRTTVPGEVDKIMTTVVDDPAEVPGSLRSRLGDNVFLSHLALDALDEAAGRDPRIAAAAVDRI